MKKKLLTSSLWDKRLVKNLIIMKLLLMFTIVFAIQTHASMYSQTTRLNLDLNNKTIREALKVLEASSKFKFFFNEDFINVDIPVSLKAKDSKIEEILDRILDKTDINYLVLENNMIVLTKKAAAQQQTVTGVVTDVQTGEVLIGANITVEGTTIGVITDVNGKYAINVPSESSVLVFSFVGYNSERVTVNSRNRIDVGLVPGVQKLDEVVVVGYGTVKKSDLTGSVSSINRRDLSDRQVSDLGALIQGKTSGVDVSQGTIRVRGVTTFNNTDPLVVIDGFIGGSLSTVNPNDIENIEILKDASSTAIYGSRGANGVILVTTKSGKSGALKINVNAFTGFSKTPKELDVLKANDYVDYVLDALKNAGQTPSAKLLSPEVRKDVTNWQDAVLRTAKKHEVDVDFSGGSEKATYFLGFGYRYSEEIAIGPSYNDVFIRNKNDFKIKPWLRAGNNFAFTYHTEKGSRPWAVYAMLTMPPYMPVKDPNNYWGYSNVDRNADLTDVYNPVPLSALSHPELSRLNYQTNVWTEIEPLKGLVYRIQVGASGLFQHGSYWQDSYINGGTQLTKNQFSETAAFNFNPLIESYLTYSKKLGKHDLSAMAGNTWQNNAMGRGLGITGQSFANTEVKNVFLADTRQVDYENYSKYAYLSYFGRFNYQFNDKYLVTFNVRKDGSPKFAPQNRWGTFPSVAVAWKLHEESFIKNLNIFDQFKLRAGWGVSGNDAIGDFRYNSKVWTNGVYYPLGASQTPVPGATIRDNASGDIKWESTDSKSIGADFEFLQNKMSFTAEYFIKKTNDILFTVPRPSSLGYGGNYGGDAIVNAASCENKGFELQAGYRNSIGDLNYTINANYTYVKNNVTSLGLGQPYLSGVSRTDIDHPIGYFYGFTADGIFKTQAELDAANQAARDAAKLAKPELTDTQLKGIYYQDALTRPGDVRYKDLDGDSKVSWDKDRSLIGSPIPKHYYGINISLDYKGIDFNAFLQGIAGSEIYNSTWGMLSAGTGIHNVSTDVLNRWKSETDPGNGIQPRAINGDPAQNTRPSTLFINSGNYLKIRQMSIGYSLPKAILSKINIEKVRIYASAYNYFTFSKYKGYDPEVGGGNLTRGIDNLGAYPNPKSLVFGIQLGF